MKRINYWLNRVFGTKADFKPLGYLIILYLCGVITGSISTSNYYESRTPTETDEATSVIKSNPQPNDWQLFKQALIEVESGGDTNAEGKTNDKGIFQITPIYIDEVNRILGQNKYTHNDAYDPDLSDYFFELVQSTRNPNKDLKKALILHNPNAMDKDRITYYEYKVMYNFYKLKCEWYEQR